MLRKLKKENGSVTIEATISLSAFMFAIVTLLTIVNICIVQARISYAINTTAREISQYSYLYSLTGLNESQNELHEAGEDDTKDLTGILTDINTVYNEIENLGQTGNKSPENVEDIMTAWDSAVGSVERIEEAGSSLESKLSDIADDPKNLMFGIAKMAASEGFDLVKSRLIAAPLAKVMCERHLTDESDGSAEDYLKFLGVVPGATGSYMDGLDFSQSTLFPYGSSEIRIQVSYDVKVISLLPIDFSFHFNQTAVTHGWLDGHDSFQSATEYVENNTLWTQSTVSERASMIRHMVIEDMQQEGYVKVSGLTDIHLYNAQKNEFVMISSMNPLWSSEEEAPKTVEDIDEAALTESIERLCGKMKSSTDGRNTVTTKTEVNGTVTKEQQDCAGATNKIVLVIPEEEGLKEKIESIIVGTDTNGVMIEVVSGYGNGASASVQGGKGGTGE